MAVNRKLGPRIVVLGLVAIAAYYLLWGGEYSAFNLVQLDRMKAAEQAALDASRSQLDSLRARVASLESDGATIERLARERFGMIREGELLYRFVPVDTATLPLGTVAASP